MVEEQDELARCKPQSGVAGCRVAGVFLPDCPDLCMAAGDFEGRVGRAIVHHDDLCVLVLQAHRTGDCLRDEGRSVVSGDDDAHRGHIAMVLQLLSGKVRPCSLQFLLHCERRFAFLAALPHFR